MTLTCTLTEAQLPVHVSWLSCAVLATTAQSPRKVLASYGLGWRIPVFRAAGGGLGNMYTTLDNCGLAGEIRSIGCKGCGLAGEIRSMSCEDCSLEGELCSVSCDVPGPCRAA